MCVEQQKEDMTVWHTLVELLEKNNLVVTVADGRGDGGGWIEQFVDMRKKKGGKK